MFKKRWFKQNLLDFKSKLPRNDAALVFDYFDFHASQIFVEA